MSAAATAAGYLYASGRLRGRGGRDTMRSPVTESRRFSAKDQAKQREPRQVQITYRKK